MQSLTYLAAQLTIQVEEVELLVVDLINDGKIAGKLDQVRCAGANSLIWQVKQQLTLDRQCVCRRRSLLIHQIATRRPPLRLAGAVDG